MVFEVYVSGPLETDRERLQMDEIIRALNAAFGPSRDVVRLIVDIGRKVRNGVLRQIDGLLITKGRLFILETKGVWCDQLTVRYDAELRDLADGDGPRWWPAPVQPTWLIDGEPWEEVRQNPLDQIRDQRRKLITLILEKIRSAHREAREPRRPWTKEEDPKYQLGKLISGFIVFGRGKLVYGTEAAEHYVKSQRWLEIVRMEDLIDNILSKTVGRGDGVSLVSEQEFHRLVEIVGAEKRLYHRWLREPLKHEYTEISRVPSLDFLFESENPANLMTAIDAAHRFRLKAYAKDIADVYFRIADQRVREKALEVLADWDHPSLGGLLVHALEEDEHSLLLHAAIGILRAENDYPETLSILEKVMNRAYDSETDYGLSAGVVQAVGNLRNQEAGKVVYSLFLRITTGDYYSRLEERVQGEEPEGRVRFEQEMLAVTLENLAACRYTGAAGQLRRLLAAFPVDRYVSLTRMLFSNENRGEYMKTARIHHALDSALRQLTARVGDTWDGKGESEIIAQIDAVYQKVLREGDDILGYISIYRPYLKAVMGIRSAEGLSMLIRHLDSLPPVTIESKLSFHSMRQEIIEAIADMRLREAFDFLAEKLQGYKSEPRLFDQQILTIVDSLRRSGDTRYVPAITAILELPERGSDTGSTESVQYIRQHAALSLAELGGRRSFEALMKVFMQEPWLAAEPAIRMLYNSTPPVRRELAKYAESLLLPRCKEKVPLPGSHEARLLSEVASEESLELLLELARKPEWYHELLPQRIMDFAHIEWVKRRLLEMLPSEEEHQRAFAIDMISGSGCLGDGADEAFSKLEADASRLVKCSLIDYHAYSKKDSVTVARYFADPDPEVKAHAVQGVQTITHRGGRRCLIISGAGLHQVHKMIYNDKGVFFLGSAEYAPSPAAPEEVESVQPFFIAADRIAGIFVYRGNMKIAGIGKAAIRGLYLEERSGDGRRLLILPLRDGRDELELHDWGYGGLWLDEIVSNFHGTREKEEAGVKKADELMRLVDQKYVPHPRDRPD